MLQKKTIERQMFYGANPEIFENAKELRKNMTVAEKILWEYLSNNKIDGFRFKSQHPISRFIADFYCHKAKLVIEIDGGYHLSKAQKELDKGREAEFENFGLRIIRFNNSQVEEDIGFVINEIKKALAHPLISHRRNPPRTL